MRSKHTLMSTENITSTFEIKITEQFSDDSGTERLRVCVDEDPSKAIMRLLSGAPEPRKTRADKGSKKPAEGGAK